MESYSFNCDSVVCMEEMGVRVGEILQYARAIMARRDIETLIRGLEEITAERGIPPRPEDYPEEFVTSIPDAVSEAAL